MYSTDVTAAGTYSPLAQFGNVARSEYRKLRSVRSTYWTLFFALAFNLGLGALLSVFVAGRLSPGDRATVDSVRLSLGGLHLSQVAIGVLGVLAITSEYGTGMIRATFSAVPQRAMVLAAKAFIFTAVALVVGVVSSFGAFFLFQALLPNSDLKVGLSDPGVLRAVFGGGLYMAVLGLFGLGLGAIIRATAGAVAALLVALFVPPLLLELLPYNWQTNISPYIPMQAGGQIFVATKHDAHSLSAWNGFGVFCLYAVISLAVGFFLLNRRDA